MRRINKQLVIILLVLSVWCAWPAWADQTEPQITAEAAVVMDLHTGKVLYQRAAGEKRPPASLTKVMTAYLTLQIGDLQQVATVSEYAASTGESTLNLKSGERITVENLLYSALLRSANDSCVAIAETIAGDEDKFIEMMNLKAKLLGCKNTTFCNTNGLPDEEHYSSAYDLALITRAAMQEDLFRYIVQQKEWVIHWEGKRTQKVKNTNRLLVEYPGAIGVKTGTTNAAGQCLIAVAAREEREVIAVVLKSKNRFYDATILLDYGLSVLERKNS